MSQRNYRRHYLTAKRIADDLALTKQRMLAHPEWHTYIVHADQVGLVKIGHARDVSKRLVALQAVNADKLTLLCVVPDNELTLHKRFARHRVHGEWFRFHDDIREYVHQHQQILAPESL